MIEIWETELVKGNWFIDYLNEFKVFFLSQLHQNPEWVNMSNKFDRKVFIIIRILLRLESNLAWLFQLNCDKLKMVELDVWPLKCNNIIMASYYILTLKFELVQVQ